jgi:plastocyanin
MGLRPVTGGLAILLAATGAAAGDLEVLVTDRAGRPVPAVVVAAEPEDGAPAAGGALQPREMAQRNLTFEPEVLVVQTGTAVSFPNQDAVKHQVYSFSPAKTFQLSLYSGNEHPPETFERAGVVTLGCNIHDSMIGYVFVTDSPYFGKTADDGRLRLTDLPAGPYRVTIWHPRIKEPESDLTADVELTDQAVTLAFALERKLKPERSNNPTQRWSDY